MIAQILNRDFVLEQMAALEDSLAQTADERRDADAPHPELEEADFQRARAALLESLAAEHAASSGQPGFEPEAPERRDELPAPLDDFAFISRDPILGNFQSALECYFLEGPGRDEVSEEEPADDRRDEGEDVAITSLNLEGFDASRDDDGRRVFDKFSITDPRWLNSVFAMGVRRLRSRKPFVDRPATPEPRPLGAKARLVMVGDWGSGLPRAIKVAGEMRKAIEKGRADGRDVQVVHLGDVYYSGWDYEYRRRFFPHWPVRASEAATVGSWLLNGNHDMYSGGWAYYDALDEERFKPYHQGSSYFQLANDHWQVFGLDTAWDDHGLAGSQGEWVRAGIEAAPARKNILLSHHQIFSAHEGEGGQALRDGIAPALATGKVTAWFWGHEHRFVVYGPHQGVQCARCIGHGGVPVYVDKAFTGDDPPVLFEMRDGFKKGFEHWAMFGYALLDLDGAQAEASYFDENGKEQFREQLP
jgi:hypothetical protein